MTNPKTQPRTAADWRCDYQCSMPSGHGGAHIFPATSRSETHSMRAAEQSVPLDANLLAEAMTNCFGGDFLADGSVWTFHEAAPQIVAEYARLVDGAQATPQPAADEETYTEDQYIDYGASQYQRGRVQAEAEAQTDGRLVCDGTNCSCHGKDTIRDICKHCTRPAAHPAGSADTALPLGSTSNGALDNAQGPNQLQGNVSRPAGSADTAQDES